MSAITRTCHLSIQTLCLVGCALAFTSKTLFASEVSALTAIRPTTEAAMLPVKSDWLTPGDVQRRSLQMPGLPPLFLIGQDARSKEWLRQRLPDLRRLNAIGLVVQVRSAEDLATLRALAPGLSLTPVSANDLAKRLALRHYPVLITSTGIEP